MLPALVLAVAHWGFGLTGLPLAVVVMMAALPAGSNALIFAQRYDTLEAEATTAIVFSTLAFAATAPLWLAVLAWLAAAPAPDAGARRAARRFATIAAMNPIDIPAYMAHLGAAARAAATAMAAASTAAKDAALRDPGRAAAASTAPACWPPIGRTSKPRVPPAWPRRCSTAWR